LLELVHLFIVFNNYAFKFDIGYEGGTLSYEIEEFCKSKKGINYEKDD
jgi:hypothetical protein